MNDEKLRRKLRKRAVKLARFAVKNNLGHVSIFTDYESQDSGDYIHGYANREGDEERIVVSEFLTKEEAGR